MRHTNHVIDLVALAVMMTGLYLGAMYMNDQFSEDTCIDYATYDIRDDDDWSEQLDRRVEDGWEIVGFDSGVVLMERPVTCAENGD